MNNFRLLTVLTFSLFFVGCSIIPTPNFPEDTAVYTIDYDTSLVASHSENNDTTLSLLINKITANPGYQTTEMIYVNKPHEISSFAKNRWLAPPADLLLPVIEQAITKTNHFSHVASSANYFKSDRLLSINLVKLQQEFLNSPSEVHLVVNVELINATTYAIIATKQFALSLHTEQDTPYAGVIVVNQLANELAQSITQFITSY